MGTKEIIKEGFDKLKNKADEFAFGLWMFDANPLRDPHTLCYVESERYADYFLENFDKNDTYESILQKVLINIICLISKSLNYETSSKLFDKPFVNESQDYVVDLMNSITHKKIFNIFGKQCVFVSKRVELLAKTEYEINDSVTEDHFFKPVFKDIFSNRRNEHLTIVCLQKSLPKFNDRREDQINKTITKNISDYLTKNDCSYICFDNFLKEFLNDSLITYLFGKILDYSKYVNFLQTENGNRDLIKSKKDLIYLSLPDAIDRSNSYEVFPLFRELNNDKLTNTNGLREYIRRLDLTIPRNVDWLSSIYTSEKIFNEIGFLCGCDNTSLVSGYLKSVEQLLSNLILDEVDKNQTEKVVFYKNQQIEISETTRDKEITLGKIHLYILNSKRFLKDDFKRNLIAKYLKEVFMEDRNGYFHKHVIFEYDKVKKIRQDSLAFTCMILNLYYYDDFYNDKDALLGPDVSLVKTKYYDLVCSGDLIEDILESFNKDGSKFIHETRIKKTNLSYEYFGCHRYNCDFHFNLFKKEDFSSLKLENQQEISSWSDILLLVEKEKNKSFYLDEYDTFDDEDE